MTSPDMHIKFSMQLTGASVQSFHALLVAHSSWVWERDLWTSLSACSESISGADRRSETDEQYRAEMSETDEQRRTAATSVGEEDKGTGGQRERGIEGEIRPGHGRLIHSHEILWGILDKINKSRNYIILYSGKT